MASAPGPAARGEGWGEPCGCGPNCFTLDGDGFTCSMVLEGPEVWRVELLMHDTFLPSVNAFVVRDAGETLVVDMGTPDEFNDTRLMRALVGLGVDPARTTVFATHAHIDHVGLARELSLAGARIVVGEPTLGDMRRLAVPAWRETMVRRMVAEGTPDREASELADVIWDHALNLEAEGIPFETVPAGGEIRCGRWSFEVVHAPGHTPGQCVLWEPSRRVAFLGDAVLYLCSTCIGFWNEDEDPLGEQIATLGSLERRDVGCAFMGHGLQDGPLAERCRANVAHHERRSARALAAIADAPGRTGYELVPAMGWHAPFDRWAETPAMTRWFLVSESIAHLDHLVATGAVLRERDKAGVSRYRPI